MAASTKMLSSIQKRRLDIRFSSFLEKRMKRDRTYGREQALRANRTAMKTGKSITAAGKTPDDKHSLICNRNQSAQKARL
jgi:hypothetical protein